MSDWHICAAGLRVWHAHAECRWIRARDVRQRDSMPRKVSAEGAAVVDGGGNATCVIDSTLRDGVFNQIEAIKQPSSRFQFLTRAGPIVAEVTEEGCV